MESEVSGRSLLLFNIILGLVSAKRDELDYLKVSWMPKSAFSSFIPLSLHNLYCMYYEGCYKCLIETFCFLLFNLPASIRTNY